MLSIAGGLLLAIAGGVFGEFFIEWARESDWYVNPSERVHAAMSAFSSFVTQPWFISVTMLVAGLAIGAWTDAILRRREQLTIMSSAQDAPNETEGIENSDASEDDEYASPRYRTLLDFFVEYLQPFASAQLALQDEILRVGVANQMVRSLAMPGVRNSSFQRSVSLAAAPLSYSPTQRPSFKMLIVSIHNAEFSSKESIDETYELARSFGLCLNSDERLFSLWDDWRVKHEALVKAYKPIKRDPRFDKLFRPLRESRWGRITPPDEGTAA